MSGLPDPVAEAILARGWGRVISSRLAAGGCINHGRVLTTEHGPRLFLKLNPSSPAGMFEREAEGLAALAATPGAPRLPAAILAGGHFLLLEYLRPAPQAADYWPAFGRRLAHLHAGTGERFGFENDNYIGSTPQPNPWTIDGYAFFAEYRLLFQARRAHAGGRLSAVSLGRVETLAVRLNGLVPPQPASLIHGDLWSGNIIAGPDGQACLIDPAAHYGWAEADLAMTGLFGSPPESFYAAYAGERPLTPGYQERFEIYNLYHLLNHLNLFGLGYAQSINDILQRYA